MTGSQEKAHAADPDKIVFEVGATLAEDLDLEDAMVSVCRRITEALGVWSCDIYDYSPADRTLTDVAVWSPELTEQEKAFLGTSLSLDARSWYFKPLEQKVPMENYVDDPELDPAEQEAMREWGETADLAMPLVIGDEVIGLLEITETRRPRRYTDKEKDLLAALAVPAAIAIQNARQYSAEEKRHRRLAGLLEATRSVTSTLVLEEVLELVAREAATALGMPGCVIYEYQSHYDTLVSRSLWLAVDGGAGYETLGTTFPLASWPVERQCMTEGAVIVEQKSDPDLPALRRGRMERLGQQTCLNVPLRSQTRPVGLMRLFTLAAERVFSEGDSSLAISLGELASAAISNAKLFRVQEQQSSHLFGLFETSRTLASSLDLGEIVEHVRGECTRFFAEKDIDADIWLRGDDGRFLPCEEVLSPHEEAAVVATPETATVTDELAARALTSLRPEQETSADGALLVVPCVARERAEGLVLVHSGRPRTFSADELEVLEILASQTAAAIENTRLYRQVERQAITDGLTGLYNHRYFHERLAQECMRSQRYGLPLSLLMLDLDDFKLFNDEYGHPLGDVVLRDVADILRSEIRQGIDLPARYGGEEFTIILPHTPASGAEIAASRLVSELSTLGADAPPPGTGATVVGERLRHDIEEKPFPGHGGRRYAHITVSIGIASLASGANMAEDLVRNADKALYIAKRSGKNRIEVFES